MPGPALAKSYAFMTGENVTLALKARKNGSATAGICEVSFKSKTMNPPRSPLAPVVKYAASGFNASEKTVRRLLCVPPHFRFNRNPDLHHHSHCCAPSLGAIEMLPPGWLLRYRRIMFVKRISGFAKFAPDRMGKSTIAQRDFLFAGLNSFEPGQEHAPHAHGGQDKLYVVLEGSGMVQVGATTSSCPPVTLPWRLPGSSIRFAIRGHTVSW
jgi:hypothetical protein